jgi:hypothetical protein
MNLNPRIDSHASIDDCFLSEAETMRRILLTTVNRREQDGIWSPIRMSTQVVRADNGVGAVKATAGGGSE